MIRNQTMASLMLIVSLVAACAGPPPAPPDSRTGQSGTYSGTPDGHYRVRRGDSLYTIAFKYGLDWREIARLNGISTPYTIYPDQVLRLTESVQQAPASTRSASPADNSSVEVSAAPAPSSTTSSNQEATRSSTTRAYEPDAAPAEPPPPQAGADEAPVVGTQAPAGASYPTPAGDPGRWLWPTEGRLISSFRANDPSRKGIDIGGTTGQAVIASAAGQVVYSGSGMLGYGELIIIKHSDRMLSAYAHNSKRMVSEGQQVPAGSQIAEMGTNDRNQAVLHFEIRVNGSPEDPLKYLPQR